MRFIYRVNRVIRRNVKKASRLRQFKKEGLVYIPPNFIFFPELSSHSTVIDVGCSFEADFSIAMIEHHGAKAFAVDPTLKHRPALIKLCEKYKGRFEHLPFCISALDGVLVFYESKTNESGSIMPDHRNMLQDETISYEVTSMTLRSLLKHIGLDSVDILKLDIEGAEYDLLGKIKKVDILPFKQIFVEFHHHALPHHSESDTRRLVDKICDFGFKSYSLDDHNYLFIRIY